jgi:hypothetical protein
MRRCDRHDADGPPPPERALLMRDRTVTIACRY